MKKTLLLTCFIAIFIFQGKAQKDWLCVYPDKKVYFEDRNNLVYCIRIDSAFNDNTVLYPFSDLRLIDWHCYSIASGSWLSKYIIIDEDGNTFFVNDKNQHIFIKSQADLQETWEVFANDNLIVKGEITSIILKSVLGVEDLVKTISFSVFDMNNAPINHILNQRFLEISKHFGLVKTVDFYDFDYQYWAEEFDLIGINEPQLGFLPINLKEDYFDFQVGDEFHIYHAYSPFGIPAYEYKTIHRYLSRTDYEDRIEYDYERKINTIIPKDTVKQIITKGIFFNTEPNEPYVDENYADGNIAKVMIKNTPLPKMYIYDIFESIIIFSSPYSNEPCLEFVHVDGCFSTPDYYLGLGGPYYECCNMWGKYCYELVYYKKGDTEVGTPFNLPVVEYEKEIAFSVYPNPASDYIIIKSANNEYLNSCTIDIYDIYGRNVGIKHVLSVNGKINVSHLQAGYYIVKILQENKAPVSIKMIKQ